MADPSNLALLAEQIAEDLLPVLPALHEVRLTDLIHVACANWENDLDPTHLNLLCEFVRRRLMQ